MPLTTRKTAAYQAGGSRFIRLPPHMPRSEAMTVAADERFLLVDAAGKTTEAELLAMLQALAGGEPGGSEKSNRAQSGGFGFDEEHEQRAYAGLEVGVPGKHFEVERGYIRKRKREE